MKKYLILTLILLLIIFIKNVFANTTQKEIYFDDMTTQNFIEKSREIPLYSIEKICSYDYCDNIKSNTALSAMEIFTENYLKTIKDEEVRASLKVKGIRITKLVLFE